VFDWSAVRRDVLSVLAFCLAYFAVKVEWEDWSPNIVIIIIIIIIIVIKLIIIIYHYMQYL
jgi:hypothetical protein